MGTALFKGLSVLAGATEVGGGVFVFSSFSKKTPNTVTYHLEKVRKRRLISSLPASEANAQWIEEYKLDKEEIKTVVLGINIDDSNGGSKLKEWCDSKLSEEFRESKNLSKMEKWCTIGKISQRIPRGKTLISGEAVVWTSLYDSSTTKKHKDKLKLSDSQESDAKNSNLTVIKKFCDNTKGKDFLVSKKSDEYDVFIEWCVN